MEPEVVLAITWMLGACIWSFNIGWAWERRFWRMVWVSAYLAALLFVTASWYVVVAL